METHQTDEFGFDRWALGNLWVLEPRRVFSRHLAVGCRVVWSREVQREGQRQLGAFCIYGWWPGIHQSLGPVLEMAGHLRMPDP